MSVIYKTLKKLKTESSEDLGNIRVSKKRKRSYPFKAVSLNPVIIISIVALILISGVGVYFAVRSLNETASHQPQPKIFPIHNRSENAVSDESSEGEEKKSLNAHYIPANATGENDRGANEKDTNTSDISTNEEVKVSNTKMNRTLESQTASVKQPGFKTLGQYSFPAKATFSPKIPEEKKLKEKVRTQRIHRANLERSLKISRLVDRIHKHIESGNISLTEKHLGELELLKGKENNFVLKLKAFSYLKRKDYESAEKLLKKVLNKSEKDLEATINMAIVEIKTKKFQQAEKRLKGLRETYPENTTILELIEKLKLSSR